MRVSHAVLPARARARAKAAASAARGLVWPAAERRALTPPPTPSKKKSRTHTQIDLVRGMVDCLYAECTPCVTDCVLAELEKLGAKYRVALKIAKDPRLERLPCAHKGTYADDCLCDRVRQHRCYIVATCDRDLRRRLRKVRIDRRVGVCGAPPLFFSLPSSGRRAAHADARPRLLLLPTRARASLSSPPLPPAMITNLLLSKHKPMLLFKAKNLW